MAANPNGRFDAYGNLLKCISPLKWDTGRLVNFDPTPPPTTTTTTTTTLTTPNTTTSGGDSGAAAAAAVEPAPAIIQFVGLQSEDLEACEKDLKELDLLDKKVDDCWKIANSTGNPKDKELAIATKEKYDNKSKEFIDRVRHRGYIPSEEVSFQHRLEFFNYGVPENDKNNNKPAGLVYAEYMLSTERHGGGGGVTISPKQKEILIPFLIKHYDSKMDADMNKIKARQLEQGWRRRGYKKEDKAIVDEAWEDFYISQEIADEDEKECNDKMQQELTMKLDDITSPPRSTTTTTTTTTTSPATKDDASATSSAASGSAKKEELEEDSTTTTTTTSFD